MSLTPSQLVTLAAHIRANTAPAVVSALAAGADNELARLYSLPASPAYVVWRRSVSTAEVGVTVNYIAVEAMTDANRARITTFYAMNPGQFEPRSDVRTFWANTFSGALGGQGQATRDALDALWRRNALLVETVFATGSGTTASPSTLGYEGSVTPDQISAALRP